MNRTYRVNGVHYRYFINRYNSIIGERVVEIQFVKKILDTNKGKQILEVGNVLSHYFTFDHKIVDKYEKESYVDAVDIIVFKPNVNMT